MTNVPSPTFGNTGFVIPDEDAVLAGVQADLNAAFGGGINPGLSTPQGQLASSETAIIGEANAVFAWFTNQVDPAFASGRMQDAIARIYFIERIAGAPTIQPCLVFGAPGVVLPVGPLAQDPNGGLWVLEDTVTIPASGSAAANFASSTNGPNPGPTSLTPYQTIFGFDSISLNGAPILGRAVETRAQFEDRRRLSTAINATGHLPAILGAVLQTPGVLDAFVTENDQSIGVVIGGVLVLANSLYVCALGGTDQDVGQAIWSRKAPGCNYTGNTTVVVTDPSPSYLPPAPSYAVTFERPTLVPFAVLAVMKSTTQVPANVNTLVGTAVVNAFAGVDGFGSRAKIGTTVLASRYYAPIAALGPWSQIVDVQLGVEGSAASIVGSISGTLLTISTISSGAVAVGNLVEGTGVQTGTTVIGQVSGTGGVGTYTVNPSQLTGGTGPMVLTTLLNEVALNINQAPAVSALNVHVQLQP